MNHGNGKTYIYDKYIHMIHTYVHKLTQNTRGYLRRIRRRHISVSDENKTVNCISEKSYLYLQASHIHIHYIYDFSALEHTFECCTNML